MKAHDASVRLVVRSKAKTFTLTLASMERASKKTDLLVDVEYPKDESTRRALKTISDTKEVVTCKVISLDLTDFKATATINNLSAVAVGNELRLSLLLHFVGDSVTIRLPHAPPR